MLFDRNAFSLYDVVRGWFITMMKQFRVLVVDDEERILNFLRTN